MSTISNLALISSPLGNSAAYLEVNPAWIIAQSDKGGLCLLTFAIATCGNDKRTKHTKKSILWVGSRQLDLQFPLSNAPIRTVPRCKQFMGMRQHAVKMSRMNSEFFPLYSYPSVQLRTRPLLCLCTRGHCSAG